jgi:hypothetical protein
MTEQFPAHLAAAIRERIAVLRQAWDLGDGTTTATTDAPRLRGYPIRTRSTTQ